MKTRLLAVLLVSSLVLVSAAAVAFAQDGRDASVQYVDCSQVQDAAGGQYGNAFAIGRDAAAEVAQELNISQNQVNACLGEIGQIDDKNEDDPDTTKKDEPEDTTGARDGEDEVLAGTIPEDTLPKTGGPSLFVAAAGAALLVGGASLIRFRR